MDKPTETGVHRATRPTERHGTACRERAFTLVELLVVITILALIAAFAAPRVFKALGGARTDAARVQIETLSTGIDLYRLEVGAYPPDLHALVDRPAGVDKWAGPYLKKKTIPKDPWGTDFIYRAPGDHGPYDLYTLGLDHTEGGDGENRDVTNWQ